MVRAGVIHSPARAVAVCIISDASATITPIGLGAPRRTRRACGRVRPACMLRNEWRTSGQPRATRFRLAKAAGGGDRRRVGAGDAVRRMLVRAFAGFLAAALTWPDARWRSCASAGRMPMRWNASRRRCAGKSRQDRRRNSAVSPDSGAVRPALLASAQLSPEATRALFEIARSARSRTRPRPLGVTIYGSSGTPVAWSGRPSDIPALRLRGSSALFMAPGPIGPAADPRRADRRRRDAAGAGGQHCRGARAGWHRGLGHWTSRGGSRLRPASYR